MISENKRNGSGYYDPTAYMAMMNVRKEGENKMEVYRGDIFYVKSNRKDTMKETTGSPAVVVSNDKGNENSNFVEIVYLTADERNLIPTHVNVMCKVPSVALCERISNVSKDRLEEYIRSCTDDEMRRIDEALMLSHAILLVGIKDEDIYIIDEIYEHEKETAEIIPIAIQHGIPAKKIMWCDSAEPDRIKEWNKAGYRARGVDKGGSKGSVNAQIDWLKGSVGKDHTIKRKIYVAPHCVNTIKELQ